MKHFIFVTLLTTLLVLSGCKNKPQPSSQAPIEGIGSEASLTGSPAQDVMNNISIPYEKSDSLNPYKLVTQFNKNIVPLLYDSLYRVDANYKPVESIANNSYNLATQCTVFLKNDIMFNDRTPVTTKDVVYSFELASKSVAYKDSLSSILSAAEGQGGVVFTLASPDALFTNLLTFPIIKYGTGEADLPTGSGRFMPGSAGTKTLVPWEQSQLSSGNLREINLVEISSRASIASAIRTKVIDYMFTTLTAPEDYSIGSSSKLVSTNSLVYLGVNSNKPYLAKSQVRRAIYMSLDRSDIVDRGFLGKARPAFTPFNPLVNWLPDVEFFDSGSNSLARELFVEGELEEDVANKQYKWDGSKLVLTLAVNSENPIKVSVAYRIKNQLESIGIGIDVMELPYSDYTKAISTGSFDLFLGEVKLKDNMDISSLLAGGGLGSAGVQSDEILKENYARFRENTKEVDVFLVDFIEKMPFIPLVYHDGIVVFSRDFTSTIVATDIDVFYNLDSW